MVSRDGTRIQPWSLWLIAAFLAGGVLVSVNYVLRNRAEARDPRPPFLGKLERDLEAQNRDGRTVRLSEWKEKVWLASQISTASPGKAQAVARHLVTLWREFGSDPRLGVVLFAVDSAGDTPEKRNDFVRAHGVDDPRWWFLAGEPGTQDLTRYLVRHVRMMPPRPANDPIRQRDWGPFEHDVRVALIDGKANLRGLYQLIHPTIGDAHLARLRSDLRFLLNPGTSSK